MSKPRTANETPSRGRGLLGALLRAVVFAFALFLAYRFLAEVVAVALSLAVGALLAVAASGPIEALSARKVPRPLAAALVFLGGAALLGLGAYLFLPALAEQIYGFFTSLPAALGELAERAEGLAERFGLPVPGGDVSPSSLTGPARRLLGGAVGVFGTAASALGGLVVVLFLAFYLSANPGPVVGWATRLFPPERRPRAREVMSAVRSGLLNWMKGQLGAMAVIGVLSTIAFFLIGLPGALFLGLLAGLLSFVPYLGPVISFVPPLLLALTMGPTTVLLVAIAYAAVQGAESYLITPLIMNKAASLHPAAVIAGVTVLGTAFGLLGALLAVPTIVTVGVLVDELWFRRLEDGDPEGGEDDEASS
ncbi:MAG: AI-2E family transporter [Actinomycetota bacterium]|nr:AI-2E family transporter [Actinomycetota bacterium]